MWKKSLSSDRTRDNYSFFFDLWISKPNIKNILALFPPFFLLSEILSLQCVAVTLKKKRWMPLSNELFQPSERHSPSAPGYHTWSFHLFSGQACGLLRWCPSSIPGAELDLNRLSQNHRDFWAGTLLRCTYSQVFSFQKKKKRMTIWRNVIYLWIWLYGIYRVFFIIFIIWISRKLINWMVLEITDFYAGEVLIDLPCLSSLR